MDYMFTKKRYKGFWFIRADSTVGPTTISSIIVINILLLYSILVRSKTLLLVKVAGMLFAVSLLIMASSRTAYIAFAVAMATMYFLGPFEKKSRNDIRVIIFLFISTASVGMANYFWTRFFSSNQLRRLEFFSDLYGKGNITLELMGDRLFLWNTAIKMSLESFLGSGYNAFGKRFNLTTHNELLGQLVGGGWLATCCFITIFVYMWFLALKLRNLRISGIGYIVSFVLALIMVALIVGLTENFSKSSSNILYPIFWFYFGILAALKAQLTSAPPLLMPSKK